MRERFSIGEEDFTKDVRKIALLDNNFKFAFKRRTKETLTLKHLSTKLKNMKNLSNFKVIDKNIVEFIDPNIDIPKEVYVKSQQDNFVLTQPIQRMKREYSSLEVIQE